MDTVLPSSLQQIRNKSGLFLSFKPLLLISALDPFRMTCTDPVSIVILVTTVRIQTRLL